MKPTGRQVVILDSVRSITGSERGGLSRLMNHQIAAPLIYALYNERGTVPKDLIEYVLFGSVLNARMGQSPSRQACLGAGLDVSVLYNGVEMVCGSSGKSIADMWFNIAVGLVDCGIAGGMENMSMHTQGQFSPQTMPLGTRPPEVFDLTMHDGLTDPYTDAAMIMKGNMLAQKRGYTNEMMSERSRESIVRALEAIKKGYFKSQIVGVPVPSERWGKEPTMVVQDEQPFLLAPDDVIKGRPVGPGPITANTSSPINDGAAALGLCAKEVADAHGLKYQAVLSSYAQKAVHPDWFTEAPIPAIEEVMQDMGVSAADSDTLFEINEAFMPVAMAAVDELGLNWDQVNVNGGAVALGHAIGASGARLGTTLLHEMERRNLPRGIFSACIGGGQAFAIGVERLAG